MGKGSNNNNPKTPRSSGRQGSRSNSNDDNGSAKKRQMTLEDLLARKGDGEVETPNVSSKVTFFSESFGPNKECRMVWSEKDGKSYFSQDVILHIEKPTEEDKKEYYCRIFNDKLGVLWRRKDHESNDTIKQPPSKKDKKCYGWPAFFAFERDEGNDVKGETFMLLQVTKIAKIMNDKSQYKKKHDNWYDTIDVTPQGEPRAMDKVITDKYVAKCIEKYYLQKGEDRKQWVENHPDIKDYFFTAKEDGTYSSFAYQFGYEDQT